ncbi:MAG: hypothetical protein ACU0B7_03480 [Paracoccaceae bacterium]
MNYCTKLDVQNYLLKTIGTSFDTALTSHIAAMSEYIDRSIGYPLHRTTETERKYDGTGINFLKIDPVHTISAVTVDGTTITPVQKPYNTDTKTELVQELAYFTPGLANVSVTGIHCLKKTLPEQIKWACTVLVALTVQQVDEQREGVQSEKIGDYSVTYQDQKQRGDLIRAKEIINSFRPIVF